MDVKAESAKPHSQKLLPLQLENKDKRQKDKDKSKKTKDKS